MIEAGIRINDTPKIQVDEPTVSDFRILLTLWGVFSYFPTNKPTATVMMETAGIYILTPSLWGPHCD